MLEALCGAAAAAQNHIIYTRYPFVFARHFARPRQRRAITLRTPNLNYSNKNVRMVKTLCGTAAETHTLMLYTTYQL